MSNQPPRIGRWLLRMICGDEYFDEVAGDLEEIYQDRVQARGKFVASTLYMKDVLLSIRNVRVFRINWAMTANLFTIAARSLKKRMSYAVLNMVGLAASIAFSFLLWMYVQDQSSYDQHFPLADRIYRVNLEANMNSKVDFYCNVPQPTAAALKSTYPQIEEAPRIALDHTGTLEYKDKRSRSTKFVIADPSVIKLFEREFIEGDERTVLSEPASVVISRSMAENLFNTIDVLGKVVHFIEFKKDLKVTGVIEDDFHNSHFPMEVIVPWDTFKEYNSDQWYGAHCYTYVLLNPANDIQNLDQQMSAFFDRYMKKRFDEFSGKGRIFFQPITEIYLSEELVWEPNIHGSKTNVVA